MVYLTSHSLAVVGWGFRPRSLNLQSRLLPTSPSLPLRSGEVKDGKMLQEWLLKERGECEETHMLFS